MRCGLTPNGQDNLIEDRVDAAFLEDLVGLFFFGGIADQSNVYYTTERTQVEAHGARVCVFVCMDGWMDG